VRILSTLTFYRPHWTGLTVVAGRLAEGLAARGHTVTVLTSRHEPGLARRERRNGVTVVRVPTLGRISRTVVMPTYAAALEREIRQCDLVHLHTPMPETALVAAIAFLRPRAGLAAALAVPLLPLGNVALALALLYGAVALAWLAVHAREPERGLLAPLGVFPGLLPLAFRGARSAAVRALGTAGAVLLGAAALQLRDGEVGMRLAGSRAPLAAAEAIVRAVPLGLALEAFCLGLASLLLPWAARKGRWGIAAWGAATMSVAVLPVPATPLLLGVWLTCGALLARPSRH